MSDYSAEIADAAADIRDAGSPISFAASRLQKTGFNMTTDLPEGSPSTGGSSYAIEKKIGLQVGNNNAESRLEGELRRQSRKRWLVAAGPLNGYHPLAGHIATWLGNQYTVEKSTPTAINGEPILWEVEAYR